MLKQSLQENQSVLLNQSASTWEEAVKLGTDLLVKSGAVEPRYYDVIISKVKELGPYIILAPGLAMPHARPEDGVIKTSFALVTLSKPVYFEGEDEGISVLITLASADNEQHMQGIVQITQLVDDQTGMNESGVDLQSILVCRTAEEVYQLIDKKTA